MICYDTGIVYSGIMQMERLKNPFVKIYFISFSDQRTLTITRVTLISLFLAIETTFSGW